MLGSKDRLSAPWITTGTGEVNSQVDEVDAVDARVYHRPLEPWTILESEEPLVNPTRLEEADQRATRTEARIESLEADMERLRASSKGKKKG
ncbi:hypothetical protein [Halomonas aquatica]|uniref:Uncharacterized protein n=1 Tax=Halomonas aquatica TaxID=3151123 RepID=A0ABV1NI58_9GAMM